MNSSYPDITIIVPPVVCHGLDPHTGIPFMPHMAAYMAGAFRESGIQPLILDCFGIAPHETEVLRSEFLLMGRRIVNTVEHIIDGSICFIYCRTIAEFVAVEQIISVIRAKRPKCKIVLFENIQAVTSYSLAEVADDFINNGCDCIICGEAEDRCVEIASRLYSGTPLHGILGIIYSTENKSIVRENPSPLKEDLDSLPMPAWDLWDLNGYWTMGFAHAPVKKNSKFLPLLTSRGCPFCCTFCISPKLNPRWRSRSASNVVHEIEYFHRHLGINDFHVSDLNPTVSDERIREICNLIIERKLDVTWKLAQGTKIETIKSPVTLDIMAKAGCVYVSFSPETGSTRLLKIMNKPFDHAHGLAMAKRMHALGIRTQAVFLAGVPGETESDRQASLEYASNLIRAGVDEISTVIFTPLPGAQLSKSIQGYDHFSQCTPSPNWRPDYQSLTAYRRKMYLNLFFIKATCYPKRFFLEVARTLTMQFETKMEMSLYKQVKLLFLRYIPFVFKFNNLNQ